MFSGFLNLFNGKKDSNSREEKPEQKSGEKEKIDEILESIEKESVEGEEVRAAYFVSEEDYKGRRLFTETNDEFFLKDKEQLFDEFNQKLKNFNYLSQFNDEFRPEWASKFGGIEYPNKEAMSIIRSIVTDIVKILGKKIMSGDFNFTTISMHIKIMQPLSIIQAIGQSLFNFPSYMNIANSLSDPLERFKILIVATLASFYTSSSYIKPLNPVIGETWEVSFEDGTEGWLEQTSHHPPVSSFYLLGPKNSFKYWGFCSYITNASLNSVRAINKGKRTVILADGTKYSFTCCDELYNNAMVGVTRHEAVGELNFKDETNGFELNLKLGNVPKKQNDFFQGEIKLGNFCVSKIHGSYVSFIEFDDIRYWDIRETFPVKSYQKSNQLPSSSIYREDLILMSQKKIEQAQIAKEKIENRQRADRKLRQKFNPTSH